jgi:nucleotide-binding universal stress UspA family protein
MLRSLLLALDGIAPCEAAIETAAVLAEAGAAVELCLTLDRAAVESPEAVGLGGLSRLEHRQAVIEDRLRHGLERVAAAARSRLAAPDVVLTVQHFEGDALEVLPQMALGHDLLLLSNALQPDADDENIDTAFALSVGKLMEVTARPILVANAQPLAPGPVVVAYDGGRASGRALHAAILLGLLDNRLVHVVTCGAEAPSIAAGAAALLRRHALQAEIHPIDSDDDVAGCILERTDSMGAALLMVGAFGERVIHDWLFGTTTDTLLRAARPPILLHA